MESYTYERPDFLSEDAESAGSGCDQEASGQELLRLGRRDVPPPHNAGCNERPLVACIKILFARPSWSPRAKVLSWVDNGNSWVNQIGDPPTFEKLIKPYREIAQLASKMWGAR